MRRDLDLTALRSFVAVAELGGVTRAASKLPAREGQVVVDGRVDGGAGW